MLTSSITFATVQVLDIWTADCSVFHDRCIPANRKAGTLPRSRKIDSTFYRADAPDCFVLGVVRGDLDCKFWYRDGLGADIRAVQELDASQLLTAVRKKPAPWTIYASQLFPPLEELSTKADGTTMLQPVMHTKSYTKVVNTLWVRFMHTLTTSPKFSAAFAKPEPLPFFQNDADYLRSFQSFDLVQKLGIERAIQEFGSKCESSSPIIKYNDCSESFNQLWKESAASMDSHVRKKGPPIIPKRTALIWPGLSLSHFLHDAIPAWSLQGRNLTQTFGKWVFDSNTQCKESTTIDTAVCADVSDTTIAVVPWLGGDYNPW
jgi:hypothetical protein